MHFCLYLYSCVCWNLFRIVFQLNCVRTPCVPNVKKIYCHLQLLLIGGDASTGACFASV